MRDLFRVLVAIGMAILIVNVVSFAVGLLGHMAWIGLRYGWGFP